MNAGTNANAPSVHKIFLSLMNMMMMSTILLLGVLQEASKGRPVL